MVHLQQGSAHGARGGFIRYSSGNFAKSLHESTFSLFYLFYLIEAVHVDPAIAGTALLLSLWFDAALNPLLGHFIDGKAGARWSYQRMIRAAAPLSATFFLLLFFLPVAMPANSGIAVFLATALFRVGATLVDVPHNALLARLSPDGYDRVRLSTWRFFFSSLGNMAVVFVLAPALMAPGTATPAHFLIPAAAITGIYLAVVVYCAAGTKLAPSRAHEPQVEQRSSALRELAQNPRLLRIFLVFVLAAALETVFSRVTVFYAEVGLGEAHSAMYLIGAQMVGQLIGLPIWQSLAAKMEKTSTAIAAQLLMVVSMAIFFAASPSSLAVALPLFFLSGVSLGGLTVMNWAIVPDTVEYTEAACGRRHEALTFGIICFLNKAGSGLAVALVGWTLAAIGYDSANSDSAAPLIGTMTAIPMIGAMASIIVLGGMRLTYREHRALAQKPSVPIQN